MEHNVGNDEVGYWTWQLNLFPLSTLTDEASDEKTRIDKLKCELGKKIAVELSEQVWLQGWQVNDKGKKRLIRVVHEALDAASQAATKTWTDAEDASWEMPRRARGRTSESPEKREEQDATSETEKINRS